MSTNYALINRIKAFETTQKNKTQRSTPTNQLASSNGKLIANSKPTVFSSNSSNNPKLNLNNHLILNDDSNNSNQMFVNSSFLNPNNNNNLNGSKTQNNDFNEFSNNNMTSTHFSSNSPTNFDRKSAKTNNNISYSGQRSTSKSQEDFYRTRLKSATNPNANAYHDKITDQKFFNRNFKLKQESVQNNASSSNNNEFNYNSLNGNMTSSYGLQRFFLILFFSISKLF